MKLLSLLLIFGLTQQQPEILIPDLEGRIHALINSERDMKAIKLLPLDDILSGLARTHSEDMAKRGFFSHTNPEGKGPRARLDAAGYECRNHMGENIYQNNLYSSVTVKGKKTTYDWNSLEKIAAGTFKAWIDDPGHRDNILQTDYDRIGIGIAFAADGKVYITAFFCR